MGSAIPILRQIEKDRANTTKTDTQLLRWVTEEVFDTFRPESIRSQTIAVALAKTIWVLVRVVDDRKVRPPSARATKQKPARQGSRSQPPEARADIAKMMAAAGIDAPTQSSDGKPAPRHTCEQWREAVPDVVKLAEHAKRLEDQLRELVANEKAG